MRGDQNPYTNVAPGGSRGPCELGQPFDISRGQEMDPQLLYGGTRVPVADDARMSGDNRWFWIALPPGVAFVVVVLPVW